MTQQGVARARRIFRRLLSRVSLRKDVPAGVVLGVESVPDGLAGGLLAGVNPVYGLYGYIFGTLFGALFTSSAFMAVQATGAMAVVVSDIPQVQGGSTESAVALFTLTVLTGVVMLGLGLARMGWIIRWVPNAVLTGFVNAVAINIVLGQLDNLTGYDSVGENRMLRAMDTILNVQSWLWPAVAVGAVTVCLIVLLERTPLGALGMVVAIAGGSAFASVFGVFDLSVARLSGTTQIPGSLPAVTLPSPELLVSLLVPAVSLAFVGLVQGAAISSTIPNPGGGYPDPSGDFRGQGIANIGAGLLQGMPVGGSMSATSIVTTAGARSRLALIVAALTMIIVVLAFSDVVGAIAMPALAGLLVVVGVRAIDIQKAVMVVRTGAVQATVMGTTFVLTLIIPLQYAVLVGVGMSVILYVVRQSNRVRIQQWSVGEGGIIHEQPPPAEVGPHEVLVLKPYGSLFFAAAAGFEAALPEVTPRSRGSAVIISLRGKEDLGSTFIAVVERYADALSAQGSRLMISGASSRVVHQLEVTGTMATIGADHVYPATSVVTESTLHALHDAHAWASSSEDDRDTPG